MRYPLLILFIGYYGSITLFTHTHIQNGISVFHSHPYSSGNKEFPVKHHHTTKEFLLIQFLSNLLTTVSFLAFVIDVLKVVLTKYQFQKNEEIVSLGFDISANGLRAPPYKF